MRDKKQVPNNAIHDLEREALEYCAETCEQIVEKGTIDQKSLSLVQHMVEEMVRIYFRMNETYTRLLRNYEDENAEIFSND